MTEEPWLPPDPRTGKTEMEEGYVIELQNVPGLSGAPVMLSSPQWSVDSQTGATCVRTVPPYLIGVIKDLLGSPAGGSQGVAVIETGERVRELLRSIADDYKAAGGPVGSQNSVMFCNQATSVQPEGMRPRRATT
jgi:hypothetical protein